MGTLIKKIKEKKTLRNLDDNIVKEYLSKYFKQKPHMREKLDKARYFKQVVKEVRNELNKVYGCFCLSDKLDLKANLSTKERLNIYTKLYKEIFNITGEPRSILDLGCGLNPLSYDYLGCQPRYIASEMNKNDCERLKKWLDEKDIDNEVIPADLTKENKFPKADVCFMFKVLDTIDRRGHKNAEKLVKSLDCKYMVISFSTKTLRGSRMRFPKRGWFERMIVRLGYVYQKLTYDNEVFYVIKKELP